jgi:hypothetical protein
MEFSPSELKEWETESEQATKLQFWFSSVVDEKPSIVYHKFKILWGDINGKKSISKVIWSKC